MSSADGLTHDDVLLRKLRSFLEGKGTQREIAEKTGISLPTLQRILAGNAPLTLDRLRAFADAYSVSPAWLLYEPLSDSDGTSDIAQPSSSLVFVREIDLTFGMGATWIDGIPVTEMVRAFPADWVQQFTPSPTNCVFFARAVGDSMMPTLLDGDIVLVDTCQRTPTMADRIWVLSWGGMGMVKRLRGRPDGGLTLLSDNSAVSPEIAYDGEAHVIGRVVAVVRKL